MSRFLVNDPTRQDARALLTAEKMATISDIVAPSSQYLTATGANELTVTADTVIAISGSGVFKTPLAVLTTADLDTGAAFVVGKNYYVYICDPGNTLDERYVISLNSTYPAGYSAGNSRKIGGFHYGKCRRVNAALQPINNSGVVRGTGWESAVFDGIVPRSVWTLTHRPKCAPEGMVYLGHGVWVDIYLSSDNGAGGLASVHNATPITGTEGLCQYDFVERALAVGKRLLTYEEFCQMALGSPQGNDANNDNAWSATTNTGRQLTGFVANAVSSIGSRDAVGDVYEWLSTMMLRAEHYIAAGNGHEPSGKWAYDTTSPFPGYGNIYQYYDRSLVALIAGGNWSYGVHAGARAVSLSSWPWSVSTNIGSRCACESL